MTHREENTLPKSNTCVWESSDTVKAFVALQSFALKIETGMMRECTIAKVPIVCMQA
jgi:hypothetical protein